MNRVSVELGAPGLCGTVLQQKLGAEPGASQPVPAERVWWHNLLAPPYRVKEKQEGVSGDIAHGSC